MGHNHREPKDLYIQHLKMLDNEKKRQIEPLSESIKNPEFAKLANELESRDETMRQFGAIAESSKMRDADKMADNQESLRIALLKFNQK